MIWDTVASWWLSGIPPLSGELRTVFYAGLLILCIVDHPSPLHSPLIIGRTESVFYTPTGLLQMLGAPWIRPEVLSVIVAFTVFFWLAAAVGLFQPLTAILTFLGFAILHGANAGALGSNHSTHSALYALFCLSFTVTTNGWSLDQILSSHMDWPRLVPEGSVLESGFARSLMLVFLVYIMFAAGVAKLRNAGFKWLNGKALRFYVIESRQYARWPAFAHFLGERAWLCRCLAWFTVLVELGALLAFVDSSLHPLLVILWICFHVGVLLTMMPAYWVQIWCYILILDWCNFGAAADGRVSIPPNGISQFYGAQSFGATALIIFGCLVCLGLLIILLRQNESWPATSVPMYSNVAPTEDSLPSSEELQALANRTRQGQPYAWKQAWVPSEAWEDIRIVASAHQAPESIFDLFETQPELKFVRWSQYSKMVRSIAISDLIAKPPGRIVHDETDPDYPAVRFLHKVAALAKDGLPEPERYRHLEFICRTKFGKIVIAKVGM